MTKRVVTDGVFGQVARRQYEIQRRIIEGTLDAGEVSSQLQRIIEGGSAEVFPIEKTSYSLGINSYDVRVNVGSNILHAVSVSGCASTFLKDQFVVNGSRCYEASTSRPQVRKCRLRLAKINDQVYASVIRLQAKIHGHILADEWDLLAFLEQAPIMQLVKPDMWIWAIQSGLVRDWWTEKGTSGDNIGKRTTQYFRLRGSTNNREKKGWHLDSSCLADDQLDMIHVGSYILLKDKK